MKGEKIKLLDIWFTKIGEIINNNKYLIEADV